MASLNASDAPVLHAAVGFFDFYIIPLAKKLKDCGVFGVSCDEYLTYAVSNRAEWEERGKDILQKDYRAWAEEYEKAEIIRQARRVEDVKAAARVPEDPNPAWSKSMERQESRGGHAA